MDGRVAYIVKQIAAVMVLMLATNLASKAQVRSQTTRLYTPTESERLRRAVNVQNWDDGGELTHFAYLHVSQILCCITGVWSTRLIRECVRRTSTC